MYDNVPMTEDFSPKKQLEPQKGGGGRKGKTAIGSGDDGDSGDFQTWSAREGEPGALRRPLTAICDESLLLRFGLALMLDPVADVCADASCGRSAIELVNRIHPELLIIDANLPLLNGVQLCNRILQDAPDTRFVVFADSFHMARYHQQFVRAGVSAFCLKSSEPQVLLSAIEHVNLNQAFCDPRIAQLLCQDPTILVLDDELTEREIDVLVRLDLDDVDIAAELEISQEAVKGIAQGVLKKLNLNTREEALHKAEQLCLRNSPPGKEQRLAIAEEQATAERHARQAIERWIKHPRG